MTLKQDGAAIKHQASRENVAAHEMGFKQVKSDLKDKIQHATWIKSLKEHPGFLLLEKRWQRDYSYKVVMAAYSKRSEKPEEFDKAIIGRSVVEDLYVHMKFIEEEAQRAKVQMEMQEKEEKSK